MTGQELRHLLADTAKAQLPPEWTAYAGPPEAVAFPAVVVVPRLVAPLLRDRDLPLPAPAVWADTEIELPEAWARAVLVDELTGRRHPPPSSGRLAVAELLAELPVALLSTVPAS